MTLISRQEFITNYVCAAVAKAAYPVWKLFLLGLLAGIIIALACVV